MPDSKQSFSIEELAVFPPPGMAIPNRIKFGPGDEQVTYLFAEDLEAPVQQLYALDVATGERRVLVAPPGGGVTEAAISPEEELRRQRERMLAIGLTHYSRVPKSERILVPLMGDIYVQDGVEAPLRKIFDHGDGLPALNPALSLDGEQVAYVRDAEVYVIPAAGGEPCQITEGARGTGKTHGLAEFIAQEELDRLRGFWWSRDGQHIAFTEVDETHIPVYRIMHQGKDELGDAAQEDHRYPFAGKANAIVRLAVVPAAGGEPVWMDLDFGEEIYIARVFWWRDGHLGAQILNRPQTTLYLVRFDIDTGESTIVLKETNDAWVSMRSRHFKQLKGGGFVWAAERTGFNHLYLYGNDDNLIRQVTAGEWMVDTVAAVDEEHRQIYFTGNYGVPPVEKHLYRVSFDGGEPHRITGAPGMHSVVIDHGCTHFVDIHSALDAPPTVTLRQLDDDSLVHTIHTPDDPRIERFDLEPPEIVRLQNRYGHTLYGAVYRPPAHFGPGPYPTIVDVYGGPGPQRVRRSWDMTANLRRQYLRDRGYLVFSLDNRGSARRGLAFESALKNRMGTVEVEDQVDGVRWLIEKNLADPDRIGATGWSYGGYMALMCLAKAPDIFKVAVSGAPVTHWDGYDTCYTERYMGMPEHNRSGYEEGSVLAHVENICGKLLLVHGLLDENVHFRHTARLANALIRARKDYDLLLFPDERHMPRRQADRVYLNERIVGYFEKHL